MNYYGRCKYCDKILTDLDNFETVNTIVTGFYWNTNEVAHVRCIKFLNNSNKKNEKL